MAKKKNGLAIIDDEEARDAAEKEGVEISGTLAMIRAAYTRCLIKDKDELEQILEDLKTKDKFRMSKNLEKWVLSAEKKCSCK